MAGREGRTNGGKDGKKDTTGRKGRREEGRDERLDVSRREDEREGGRDRDGMCAERTGRAGGLEGGIKVPQSVVQESPINGPGTPVRWEDATTIDKANAYFSLYVCVEPRCTAPLLCTGITRSSTLMTNFRAANFYEHCEYRMQPLTHE